jgi:hypothetical protein
VVKTAVRQVAIKCGKVERKLGPQGLGPPWMPGQQKAQFGQGGGAVLDRGCRRKCWRNKHLMALLRIKLRIDIPGMFLSLILEQKENKARGKKFEIPRCAHLSQPWLTFISRYSAGYFAV